MNLKVKNGTEIGALLLPLMEANMKNPSMENVLKLGDTAEIVVEVSAENFKIRTLAGLIS